MAIADEATIPTRTRDDDEIIIDIIKSYAGASPHPDQKVYAASFIRAYGIDKDGGARYLRAIRQLLAAGNIYNCRVLEAGCGCGWDAVAMALLGNNVVTASDILPSMIDAASESLAALKRQGIDVPVRPVVADICHADFPDASFDVVCSFEAVEHVHSLERMFDQCARLLVPGGRLVIANDSNRYNSQFVADTFKMWRERDTSWEHMDFLRTVRPVEHEHSKPYAAMREAIVREASPALGDAAVSDIVTATAGMIRPDIAALARDYQAGATLPTPPTYAWCRNPETGEYAERLLDPFEMADMLRSRGFRRVRLGHPFQRFPHRLLNNVQFRPLNKVLFDLRPGFIISAVRQ